jgi:hypothetical protein
MPARSAKNALAEDGWTAVAQIGYSRQGNVKAEEGG